MNVHYAKLIMYYEIHRLQREDLSITQISQYLSVNRRTVMKYLAMNEQEYELFLVRQSERKKELQPYEMFVKERLELYRDTSCAQMHDWLKEHHADFPAVSAKTVFNFVNWIRSKYNLTKLVLHRQFEVVAELPYGEQGQVDFGEYNLRMSDGKRVKVYFFTLVLSRSRYKYIWFSERPFTTQLAIEYHEKAFEYLIGMPHVLVYDQDTVFIVSENRGDIILTDKFRAYSREQGFGLHFCRKADPQSKGKVENVVKYVKQNFLYNRTYFNIDTLNDDAMGWLGRTANMLPHAFTQLSPFSELIIERPFLRPYTPLILPVSIAQYTIRKDNTISYKSNLYSLPLGTYQGRGSVVGVNPDGEYLVISGENKLEICRHKIAEGKGLKILNSDHRRDKSLVINEMIKDICTLFEHHEKAEQWLETLRTAKPRYIRDQLGIVKKTIQQGVDTTAISLALDYCVGYKITSAADFKSIVARFTKEESERQQQAKIVSMNPLNGVIPDQAFCQPQQSQIADYQTIFNQVNS